MKKSENIAPANRMARYAHEIQQAKAIVALGSTTRLNLRVQIAASGYQ